MLRSAQFALQLLDEPNHPIPLSAFSDLVERSARVSESESFGLMMCETRTLGSLGPLAVLLAQDSSCREVIEHLIRFQRLLGEAAVYSLDPEGDVYIFRTEIQGRGFGPQVRECQMGLVARLLRDWLRLPWAPESVHFVHPAPRDLTLHSQTFRCRLEFESAFNGFVCTAETLDGQRSGGDPELAAEALRMVDQLTSRDGDLSLEDRTRRAIRLALSMGGGDLERVAWSMDLSPRKLQRLLEDEQSSFRALLNEVRGEIATEQLCNRGQTVGSVAFMTGFATSTAFTRWFKDHFGLAPSAWRAGAAVT